MSELEIFIEKIKSNKDFLKNRFGVKAIGIFGSYVRGEQNSESDVDILIETDKPVSLFDLVELEDFLSELLGKKVDLVLRDELKPRISKNILKEVAYI